MTRRLWRLTLVAAAVVTTALVALSACADSEEQTAREIVVPPSEPDSFRVQLDWLPNTNHTGIYVALAQGWYEDENIDLEILPYSGGPGELMLDQGVADAAFTVPTYLPLFRAQGLDVVSIAAVLQSNPIEFAVLADGPIERPRDLDGHIYGGFGVPTEQAQWEWVVRYDGGRGDITGVVLDTGAYEALYDNRVQGVETFVTWDGIDARLRGIEIKSWKYSDFGIPEFHGMVLAANRTLINDDPDLLTRFLAATIKGYEFAVSEPEDAAQMMIDIAGEDAFPNLELVFESARMLAAQFYVDPEGRWGSQTLDHWRGYTEWLYEHQLLLNADGDPLSEPPDYGAHFTNDLYAAARATLN